MHFGAHLFACSSNNNTSASQSAIAAIGDSSRHSVCSAFVGKFCPNVHSVKKIQENQTQREQRHVFFVSILSIKNFIFDALHPAANDYKNSRLSIFLADIHHVDTHLHTCHIASAYGSRTNYFYKFNFNSRDIVAGFGLVNFLVGFEEIRVRRL